MRKHLGKNLVIVLALLAAGFFIAFLRFRPFLGNGGSWTDGEKVYQDVAGDEIRYAVWGQPELLPGDVNTDAWEGRPAVSPDGRYLVFCVGTVGLNADLYVAELVDGLPVDARALSAVNTSADECAPAFSGDALYFSSNRGDSFGGLDLYQAEYRGGQLGKPRNLGPGINTGAEETDPAPVPGSLNLAFASDRGGRGDYDLFLARPQLFGRPGADLSYDVVPLETVNTLFEEREPSFAADGNTLVFASDREESLGGYDLFRSVIDRGEWTEAAPIPSLNTRASERGPFASRDGFSMLFSVEESAGRSDLFRVSSRELFHIPGRPIGWLDLSILGGLLALALMAFLAKRWAGLEFLYKCLLISVLVHALIVFFSRDVEVGTSNIELPGREPTFKVRLTNNNNRALAERQVRDGQVEARRQEAAEPQAPERSESVAMESQAAAAPERALARAQAPAASAPQRSESEYDRTQDVQGAPVQVQQPAEQIARLEAQAPSMSVAEQALPAREADTRTEAIARSAETVEAEIQVSPQARESRLAASQPVASPEAARAAQALAPSESVQGEASQVAVARPQEELRRMQGQAPAMAAEQARARQVPQVAASTADPSRRSGERMAVTQVQPRQVRDSWTGTGLALAVQNVRRDLNANRRLLPGPQREQEVELAEDLGPDPTGRLSRAADAPSMSLPTAGAAEQRGADMQAYDPARMTGETPSLHALAGAQAPARGSLERGAAQLPQAGGREQTAWQPMLTAEEQASVAVRVPEEDLRLLGVDEAPRAEPSMDPGAIAAQPSARAAADPTRHALESAPRGSTDDLQPMTPGMSGLRPATLPERQRGQSAARLERSWSPTERAADGAEVAVRVPEESLIPSMAMEAGEPTGGGSELLQPQPLAMGQRIRPAAPETGITRQSFGTAATEIEMRPSAAPIVVEADQEPEQRQEPEMAPTKWDHTPYQSRFGGQKEIALRQHGGSKETEAAVDAGLAYLAGLQQEQGHWGTHHYYHGKYGYTAIGKTGLALLAFLGAGHTPDSETKYSGIAAKAVNFLLGVQSEDSGHFSYTSSYSHGIATYALAECYALTEDPRLRRPLERAVAHIVSKQNLTRDRRLYGGWSYYYSDDRTYDQWPRASITAWQVMALESARLGGIEVPDQVFDDAKTFLVNSQDEQRGFFRYSHDPTRLRSNYPTLPGSTPASIFALSILGEDVVDKRYTPALQFILKRAPQEFRYTSGDDFVYRATGNIYFWYYGTLAMFRTGGKPWEVWNERLKNTLLPAQEEDGSWQPISLYADYAGDSDEDRTYTTAMCVLSLEVYYRYFTPLLQVR